MKKGAVVVKDGDYIAIFNSIHRVMAAEKLLKEKHLTMLLIPAPRALTADCGLASGTRKMPEQGGSGPGPDGTPARGVVPENGSRFH